MEGILDFSIVDYSSDDEETVSEQELYFPVANDTFESGNIFLPHEPITVEITHVYWVRLFSYFLDRNRSPSRPSGVVDGEEKNVHKVPSRYEISLKHGPFEWKILRRHNDFIALHRDILVDQVKHRFRRAKKTVTDRLQANQNTSTTRRKKISVFPKRPNITVTEDSVEERKRLLTDYLQSILNIRQLRYLEGVLRFFEVCPLTFRKRLGLSKFKESTILKIPRSRRRTFNIFPCCVTECAWQTRWLVLKDSYLVMLEPRKLSEPKEQNNNLKDFEGSQSSLITVIDAETNQNVTYQQRHRWHRNRQWRYCKVFLVDKFFNFHAKNTNIGEILHIGNMHGEIKLRVAHGDSVGEWVDTLTSVLSKPSALGFIQENPHKSFAPVRKDGNLMLCIDGASYMDSVAEGINQAKYEIFITDWWLSPEIFMKRPGGADKWRLDLLLKRKAEEGVRVCVLIYRELTVALNINSKHTSKWLSGLHRNIHVIRHPDHLRDSVLLWSHHEKLVVIDQSIAFMGGIDLCFGRWDRQDHPLLDLDASVPYTRTPAKKVQVSDAAKSVLMALMPLAGDLPDLTRMRRNSMGLLATDLSPEEIEMDRRKNPLFQNFMPAVPKANPPFHDVNHNPNLNNLATTARMAVNWKRSISKDLDPDKPGLKVLPDGQLAFRSSGRRKSGRRNRNISTANKPSELYQQTVDIQLPGVGRVQVPVGANEVADEEMTELDRIKSDPRLRIRRELSTAHIRNHSVAVPRHHHSRSREIKGGNKHVRSKSISEGIPMRERDTNRDLVNSIQPLDIPELSSHVERMNRLTVRSPSPTHKRNRFSAVDFSNKIQGFFSRRGSTRVRSPIEKLDSDDSDELEYDNLGFHSNKQVSRVNIFSRRQDTLQESRDDEQIELEDGHESRLAALSYRYLFVGKDYGNWLLKDACELNLPEEDLVDRSNVPRMPWHDCGCAVSGSVAADFARHFIQRWNATRTRKVKRRRKRDTLNLPVPPVLLPTPLCEPWIQTHLSTVCGNRRAYSCQMQALRSAGRWALVAPGGGNGGTDSSTPNNLDITPEYTEHSIVAAYVDAIRESEHYIYIENQFYISWLERETMHASTEILNQQPGNGDICINPSKSEMRLQSCVVQNPITQAIYNRILRAYREGKPYRVYIILPLLPGFQGDPGSRTSGISIHCVLHYIRESLFRGPTALIPRLNMIMSTPWNYVSVCGLRKWDSWPDGILTTEFIYVHCKLMIVDDKKLIIGSANINDRSMLGYRDSELAVIAEDTAEVGILKETTFAGQKVMVGELARRFRKSLMAEHLGVLTKESRKDITWDYNLLDDPVCDRFYHDVWCKHAKTNMELFEKVFNCLPSNEMHSFVEVKTAQQTEPLYLTDPEQALKLVKQIRGTIVRYPEDFLRDEDISPPQGSKEIVVPEIVWT